MPRKLGIAAAIATASLASCCTAALAQTINIWPGPAPGSEHWTQQERTITDTPIGAVVLNVVTPTLTAYLPEPSKATGTGIIVAPGGAFVAITLDLEGASIAKRLQQSGIAAFVLKYRVIEKRQEGIPNIDMDAAGQYGIADGIQALKVVRQHAAEWYLSPDRIGIIGFSAGAMVASLTALQPDPATRPNFAALIYGGPFGKLPPVPAGVPPIFMAWAQDDTQAAQPAARFYSALMAAGNKPEAHIFSTGGHGFGLRKQGTTSDHWIDEFSYWLASRGLTTPTSH